MPDNALACRRSGTSVARHLRSRLRGHSISLRTRRSQLLAAVLGSALAVLGAAQPAQALDPEKSIAQYVRRAWDTDSGLSQSTVIGIVQSDDGYLWIGTRDGLCRFDG